MTEEIKDPILKSYLNRVESRLVDDKTKLCECGGEIHSFDWINKYPMPHENLYLCSQCGWKQLARRYMPILWERYINCSLDRHPEEIKNKVKNFPDHPKNLLIIGHVGRGKTDLAFCLIKKFVELKAMEDIAHDRPLLKPQILILDAFGAVSNVKTIYKERGSLDVLKATYDLYFIDGVGDSIPTQDIYCIDQLINFFYSQNRQFILTTNLPKRAFLEKYGERVTSRLAECAHVLTYVGKDRRTE